MSHFRKEETISKGRIDLPEAKNRGQLGSWSLKFLDHFGKKTTKILKNKFQKSSSSSNIFLFIYLFIFISKFTLVIKK